MRLAPKDLYRLRRQRLVAQRAALRAQFAELQLQETSLELERRYGLLGQEAALDLPSGVVTLRHPDGKDPSSPGFGPQPAPRSEVAHGSADHAHPGTP